MTVQTLRAAPVAPRLIYILDAVVCLAMGLALVGLAVPLAELAGTLPPAILFWAGVVLVPWAAFNLYTARARIIAPGVVAVHLLGDAAWVIGSVAVLVAFAAGLGTLGFILIAGQAVAVAGVFAVKLATRHALG